MNEESRLIFRGNKCANIIVAIKELFHLSLKDATDIYYTSETALLIDEGIADLQCRSDKYLATLIWEEYQQQNH